MTDEYLRQIIELQREMLTELRLLREGLFPQGIAKAATAAADVPSQDARSASAGREDDPSVVDAQTGDDVLAELLTDAEHALLLDDKREPEPEQAAYAAPSKTSEPAGRRASGLRFPGFGGFTDDEDEPAPARAETPAAGPAPERQNARANGQHAPSEDVDELRGLFDTGKSQPKARQPAMDDLSGTFGEAGERGRGGARVTTSDLAGELGDLLSGLKRRNRERAKTFEEFQGRFGKR